MDDDGPDFCEQAEQKEALKSPKPMAFTIDFSGGKAVDTQRHKSLVEKYQQRHRRGQSLSKIEDVTGVASVRKPQSANLPRRATALSNATKSQQAGFGPADTAAPFLRSSSRSRDALSLPLRNTTNDRMTQSCTLPCIESPQIEVTDITTLELEDMPSVSPPPSDFRLSMEIEGLIPDGTRTNMSDGAEFDKSDAISDAGTYTLDPDAYSEEQKARMSIDREFKIETVSNIKKAEDYVQSLGVVNNHNVPEHKDETVNATGCFLYNRLSPIVSPTQNISITDMSPPSTAIEYTKSFNKIMFPSPKAKTGIGSDNVVDYGSVISVTSSGAFRTPADRIHARKLSLTKSDIQVEAYTGNSHHSTEIQQQRSLRNLSTNIVAVSEALPKEMDKVTNLPPTVGGITGGCGKLSPSKIPSPIHSMRPRSRNSDNSLLDLSDSSLDTDHYLKPTEDLLNTLQQCLSLDSDPEVEGCGDVRNHMRHKYLNNDARSLLKRPTHLRHNSLDEKISNKLEHFQHKKFIDQTNVLNQYKQPTPRHKIQNSPNNSPIRRSSSFSTTKNQLNTKSNISHLPSHQKETNLRNAPSISNGSIQRSASTATIRSNFKIPNEHKIDRSQFGDTESSSEEDLHNNAKKKDIPTTRYNRAFSLRRGRLDTALPMPPAQPPKCPNTPEMRRKFQPGEGGGCCERAISADRKPALRSTEVQSRYLRNITKNRTPVPSSQVAKSNEPMKSGTKMIGNTATKPAPRAHVFSRTDSGRLSMRSNKPPILNSQKPVRREGISLGSKKQSSGPRSNSSLSSKEVEFQNWKRRKSYDPMKAAAEGKRKAELAKRQNINSMTHSYHEGNQECDSSPSHSSSVHRSQSFHGTAALEQYISSDDDEELTISADETFSPPAPSPRNQSPSHSCYSTNARYTFRN